MKTRASTHPEEENINSQNWPLTSFVYGRKIPEFRFRIAVM